VSCQSPSTPLRDWFLIAGCAHPGIDRIVEAAAAIDKHIHLIAGGL
jgi:metal-dependent hydrolase (beta-lactamase superfamily II)